MSEPVAKKARGGWLKAGLVGMLGLGGGAVATYATAVVDRVARPGKPVANFAVTADGLTVTCQNHASGESGWWDFGDGTPLEPFSPEAPATHTYARPGSYTVKLTVRNFLADENERSVPVEVQPGAKDAAAPRIAGFAVLPVSAASVAPATFRVTAEVTAAEHCVWDFGDGRLEVADGGKIDRLVTFEKPGAFPVQLVAHNGKAATKQAAAVKVDAPKDGTLMAVLKVTDTGTRVERVNRSETVAVPLPKEKDKTAGFNKAVAARPGFVLVEAAPAGPPVSAVKNLKVQVAADKRSAAVAGEWADPKAAKGGGSDVLIPVRLTEERTTTTAPVVTMVSGMVDRSKYGWAGAAHLPLPPAPVGLTGARREYQIEIREQRTGTSTVVVRAPADGKGSLTFPWEWPVSPSGGVGVLPPGYFAKLEGDKVLVGHIW